MRKVLCTVALLGVVWSTSVQAQTETSGRKEVYRATHTKWTELKHTKLKVSFDYEKEQMNGEEWLTASPYFYPSDSLVLNAKAMLIHEVALDQSGKKSPLKYEYKNDMLKINLDKKYTRNQDYTVYIKYTARPNEVQQKGSSAITDAKGLYFINAQGKEAGKPTQIWTQGETESSSVWFPTIDKPNQKTTQEILMTVPDKYVTLSNGLLKSSKKEGNNLRTDHWVMDKKHAPYLFFMGVGDYAVVKDKWRNIDVDYYVEKEYEPYAKEIFGHTPAMMEFYSKLLKYDYPWSKYAQMTARDYVSGAMENTTATLHSDMAQQKPGNLIDENIWEATIAHELFHHWFGDLVTTESWSNLTINESFANYSEYLWFEHKYGKDWADYHMSTDLNRYKHNSSDHNKHLARFDYKTREDMFDLVSYNKGGGILHMLRNYIGDEAFFESLNQFLKTYEYQAVEYHQLRLIMEKVTGKDLNWFFSQWYEGAGHPKLSSTQQYDPVEKKVKVTVNQAQTQPFEFPLTIDVFNNGKVSRQKVWVEAKSSNTFSFDASKNPDYIAINADGIILSEITDSKTPLQNLLLFNNTKEYVSRKAALDGIKDQTTDSNSIKLIAAALKDPFHRIRMQALQLIDLSKPEHAKAFASEVEKIATNDSKTLVQAGALSVLAKTKDKKYATVFEKAISSVSNAVKGGAILGLSHVDPTKVAQYANNLDMTNASEDLVSALLPVIVSNKIDKHLPAIVPLVAFYPFLKFQDAELGKVAEDGFNWLMTSDNAKANQNLVTILTQVKSQLAANPQAKMMMVQMLNAGLKKKLDYMRQNPDKADSINGQIDALQKVIKSYE